MLAVGDMSRSRLDSKEVSSVCRSSASRGRVGVACSGWSVRYVPCSLLSILLPLLRRNLISIEIVSLVCLAVCV